jgi:hypothetical protein
MILLIAFTSSFLYAQTLYVDQAKGKSNAAGSYDNPLGSINDAIKLLNSSHDNEAVIIKLAPGLYTLTDALEIKQKNENDTSSYAIEAITLPDDKDWSPSKMPVIQVVADSNREGRLRHASIAFEIERNNVLLKGLKFIGNPNPSSEYYYAIERRNKDLKNLTIQQCYFVGDKNASPMQGGVFAQGKSIHINHCIFYNCKNAVLCFLNVKDFSITHTIINGAYEAAVWFGYADDADIPFIFHDNIVVNGNYFWVGDKGVHKNYTFSNSIIANNHHYIGINGDTIEGEDSLSKPTEKNIYKSAKVMLSEITANEYPKDYLNVLSVQQGIDIKAGIFINRKANPNNN